MGVFKSTLLGLASLLVCQPGHAQLAINRLWLDFETPSQRRGDLVILNESSDKYYISVETSEIKEPGTESESRVTSPDPEELGLLVTPNRLVLEPGQSRSLRVVRLDTESRQDRIYRIKIEPKVGEISADGLQEEHGMIIKVLAAYDVLVTCRPDDGEFAYTAERTSQGISVSNTGNTNFLLFNVRVCDEDETCEKRETVRVYSGGDVNIDLADGQTYVSATMRETLSREPHSITLR